MITPLTPDLIRRLAFVRYLLGVGIDQSRRPDPLAAVALLTLHDAAEMFLQIVAEHQNASDQERNFIAYWNKLEKKGVRLSHRVAMERLNAARVNLKHRGVSPSHADIEGFRETVSSFLLENAKEVLGIDFDRLSLTHLLKSDTVRQLLEAAEAALGSGDLQTAMGESAQAFVRAMTEYRSRPRRTGQWTRGYDLHGPFAANNLLFGVSNVPREARRIVEAIDRGAQGLAEAITIVGYNLDFEGYLLFKSHTPWVHQFIGGRMQVEWNPNSLPTDPELVRRCVAFVVDTTIRLEAGI